MTSHTTAGWAQSLAYDVETGRLYVGDRAGGLYIYDCSPEAAASTKPDAVQQPVHGLPKAHGKKTVTDILLDEDGSIFTAGRDGYYRHYTVEEGSGAGDAGGAGGSAAAPGGGEGVGGEAGRSVLTLTCLGKHRVTAKLDWIVRLEKHNGSLVALGFEKDHFTCIDISTGTKLCRISCGGGHRSWGFASGSNMADNHVFVFIRNSLVNSSSISPTEG